SPYRAAASTHGVETRSQSHRRDRKVARWCLSFGSQGSCVRRGLRALSAEVRRLIEAEKDLELVGELDRLYPRGLPPQSPQLGRHNSRQRRYIGAGPGLKGWLEGFVSAGRIHQKTRHVPPPGSRRTGERVFKSS